MSDALMDQRVSRLEQDGLDFRDDMKAIRADLNSIRADQAAIRSDLGYVRGRIEQLPSTWVMLTGIIGGQIALAGLLVAASRLLGVR